MDIYIGADHRGYEMKGELIEWLKSEGHEVEDMGATELDETDDYPDYGIKVAEAVALRQAQGKRSMGILLCGSGVGMAVAAGKVDGIRAALIHDVEIARAARNDDDINVLAIGSDYIDVEVVKEVLAKWLATSFSGEARHVRRIGKITEYEKSN